MISSGLAAPLSIMSKPASTSRGACSLRNVTSSERKASISGPNERRTGGGSALDGREEGRHAGVRLREELVSLRRERGDRPGLVVRHFGDGPPTPHDLGHAALDL